MKPTRNILISIGLMFTAGISWAMSEKMAVGAATVAPEIKQNGYVEPKINHEKYDMVKIVVPVTTDDKTVQEMKLRNIENALKSAEKWGGQIESTVVLYAKGVSLLKNPDSETKKKLDALRARGVQFDVCDNTLREQGINFHQLYGVRDADIVPSGFAEVAYLQAKKQYVVDPIN